MASYNRVLLMGNLTRDPQLKFLPSQTQVVEFGLAMNRRFKTATGEDREEVCFVDCSAFGRTAEVINQYFTKGKPIFIEGRLKLDQWEDKQGGGKRSKLSVVIENFQFVGGRDGAGGPGGAGGGGYDQQGGGGGGGGDPQYDQRPRPPQRAPMNRGPAPQRGPAQQQPTQPQQPPAEQPYGDEEQFKEDDIPF
jgi:single-strand DNA-binding protein